MIKYKKNAFTLVEMLVVIVLLSMLIATAVFAYKNMIINIKQTKRDNYKELLSFHYLKSSINSMVYYVVQDNQDFIKDEKQLHYFFDGNENSVKYITKNPIFSDEISVAFIQCKEHNLVYKESLLYGVQNYLTPSILESSKELILYKNLDDCKFGYILTDELYSLKNTIPKTIHIILSKNENTKEFYFNIKSNMLKTIKLIGSEIFDEK